MKAPETLPNQLLHNMSVAPKTAINHGGGGYAGQHAVFSVTHPAFAGLAGPSAAVPASLLLEVLDGSTPRESRVACERELRDRLDRCAQALDLPRAAPVIPTFAGRGVTRTEGLLESLTVAAKSSDHVYLRDKSPNLSRLTPGRTVILLVPLRSST